MKINTKKGC